MGSGLSRGVDFGRRNFPEARPAVVFSGSVGASGEVGEDSDAVANFPRLAVVLSRSAGESGTNGGGSVGDSDGVESAVDACRTRLAIAGACLVARDRAGRAKTHPRTSMR